MTRLMLIFVLLISAALISCASTTAARDTDPYLGTLATWMAGSFSSAEQAQRDPEHYLDIRLQVTPIWSDRADGHWLYVEQAAATALDRPYRQRVYRVTSWTRGVYESAVYTLPGDPLEFAGAWRDPSRLDAISPDDLTLREGCSILMTRDGEAFVGSTHAQDCPSDLRGAAYATSRVRITADQLASWDQGFDAAGNQVWGATEGPYIFRRIKH